MEGCVKTLLSHTIKIYGLRENRSFHILPIKKENWISDSLKYLVTHNELKLLKWIARIIFCGLMVWNLSCSMFFIWH